MRGDSLRDLYAKALALLGLALLAGIGALVDYWPISNDFPTVARLKNLPAADLPSSAGPVDAAVTPPVLNARVVRPVRPAPAAISVPASVPASVPSFTMAIARFSPASVRMSGKPAALAPLVVAKMEPVAASPVTPRPAAVFAVSDPDPTVVEIITIVPPVRGDDDGSKPGFVTGALKKTGQTLTRTGAKAGASIRDALVYFGGAFRKIL